MNDEAIALAALRQDLQKLSTNAARMACVYLENLALTDWWASALWHDLRGRAGGAPLPDIDTLSIEFGEPGHWRPTAYASGDVMEARLWLAAVAALAGRHAPTTPPAP
jgi:hypothetical protein